MPMHYFKCECGTEKHAIRPIDKTGFRQMPNGSWKFDPSLPQEKKALTIICENCSKEVAESEDPKAVRSFLKLNWLEQ